MVPKGNIIIVFEQNLHHKVLTSIISLITRFIHISVCGNHIYWCWSCLVFSITVSICKNFLHFLLFYCGMIIYRLKEEQVPLPATLRNRLCSNWNHLEGHHPQIQWTMEMTWPIFLVHLWKTLQKLMAQQTTTLANRMAMVRICLRNAKSY